MTTIDDALQEWDETFRFKPLRGRKAKVTITGVRIPTAASQPRRTCSAAGARSRLKGIVRKTPEVMVKVSGGGKGMRAIKAHMDYISRNGDVALENEDGEIILGRDAVRDLRDEWKNSLYGIPEESSKKEGFNIVLSMPPGTARKAVTDAVREFAKTEFSGNFQYVFATHDDEKHPHVHLCVKAQGMDGTRLNPRKADLQRWREEFAEALHEHGIEANATRRLVRGARRRTRRQAALHVDASQRRPQGDEPISKAPQKVVKGYELLANALAQGGPDDRSLALGIVNTVKGMKAQQSTHVPGAKNEAREVSRDGTEARRASTDSKQTPER
jgi:type IV secretory pathway VirD2 relaxase